MLLNFVPKARPGESVSSLMIRQAEGLHLSPGELLSKLGTSCNTGTELIALLRGNQSVLRDHWSQSNWKPSKFYLDLAQSRRFRHWVNYNNVGVCPLCAQEGLTPESHDFEVVTACTKHSMMLARACQSCERPLSVNRYRLTHCRCGVPIRSGRASSRAIDESHYIEQLMKDKDLETLSAFRELKTIMRRLTSQDIELGAYKEFLNGRIESLLAHAQATAQELPGIPLRALCAPFASAKSDAIKLMAPGMLSKLKRPCAPAKNNVIADTFYLTQSELRYVFGLKQKSATALETHYFNHTQNQGPSRAKFPYSKLSAFFRPLLDKPCTPGTNSISLAKLSVSQKEPLDRLVQRTIKGDLEIAGFDEKLPLSQIHIVPDADTTSTTPAGYMTMEEVVARLDSYEEAIRGVRDAGLLPATHQRSCNNRYLFSCEDVESFHARYVLIGELAREVQFPPVRLSDRLRQLGVIPVAGPYEGNSTVSVYERADLCEVELRGAASIDHYSTNSGRRSAGGPTFDAQTWATGHEVATELDVPISQLSRITRYDLLVKGTPRVRGSERRYYYRRSSISTTKAFLSTCITLDDLARELEENPKKLVSRYQYLLNASPICVKDQSLIPLSDTQELREHYRQFLDARAAAKYLGTTRHQIGNWKKARKLRPLQQDDENFIRSPQLYRKSDLDALKAQLNERFESTD